MHIGSDVFISYATDTQALAEVLTRALQKQGIRTWADFQDLQPGQRRQDEVEHALERAQSFVILVSPQSRSTPSLEAEWRAALAQVWSDSDKTLLPVVVGGDEPPPFLRNWVSLRIDPTVETADWTGRVLRALWSGSNQPKRDRTSEHQQERQQRLDEIGRAAEELGAREPKDRGPLPDSKS